MTHKSIRETSAYNYDFDGVFSDPCDSERVCNGCPFLSTWTDDFGLGPVFKCGLDVDIDSPGETCFTPDKCPFNKFNNIVVRRV